METELRPRLCTAVKLGCKTVVLRKRGFRWVCFGSTFGGFGIQQIYFVEGSDGKRQCRECEDLEKQKVCFETIVGNFDAQHKFSLFVGTPRATLDETFQRLSRIADLCDVGNRCEMNKRAERWQCTLWAGGRTRRGEADEAGITRSFEKCRVLFIEELFQAGEMK